MVPLALGSDGGGSVRIPASLSGRVRHQAFLGARAGVPGLPRRTLPRHLELGIAGAHRPDHAPRRRRGAGAVGAVRPDAARPLLAAGRVRRLARGPPRPCRRHRAWHSASTWAMPWSTPKCAPRSRRRRCAWAEATGRDAVQWRHPAIGDTQAMFETLVALDTDRVGLQGHGTPHGRDAYRLAGGAGGARLERRRVQRGADGAQAHRQHSPGASSRAPTSCSRRPPRRRPSASTSPARRTSTAGRWRPPHGSPSRPWPT